MEVNPVRRRWRLEGVVQGVGFRPFVATIAARAGVVGFCGNDERGVFIEAEGSTSALDTFRHALFSELPALSRIISHTETPAEPLGSETSFRIVASRHSDTGRSLIPPDTALCPQCREDFFDPNNRRYRYPFISCTNCGPRLSIIEELPYDRPRTTMSVFPMCQPCQHEYTDPADRRYHAQPISCYHCGPRMQLVVPGPAAASESEPAATPAEVDALIAQAHRLLDGGAILAVKGIGGFHLVCDARNETAVATLRRRKRRPDKPLAVMVPTLESAKTVVALTAEQAQLLASPEAPIVIAPKAHPFGLAPAIAPDLEHCGVMLPYSGIHLLLCDRPLVVTSGNISGEPVCTDNASAMAKLGAIADAFVMHDRAIEVPVEDSVFIGTNPTRRSRGFAPLPVALTAPGTHHRHQATVVATGGEMKNTLAIAHGDLVHISAHIGDMGSWTSQQAWSQAAAQLLTMRAVAPELIVCDLHPGYATTTLAERLAAERDLPLLQIQHHWAHALSLLAEHRLLAPGGDTLPQAIVATLDGTGYGTDGTVWGGEILALSRSSAQWQRVWHCPTFPLIGGDRAVAQPWRVAAGMVSAWGLTEHSASLSDGLCRVSSAEIDLVTSQIASGVGATECSSLGRIFDAVAALIVPRWRRGETISYQGQAAMELEAIATAWARTDHRDLTAAPQGSYANLPEVVARATSLNTPGAAALAFHQGLAGVLAEQLSAAAETVGTDIIGLSGGCADNQLLVHLLEDALARRGHTLVRHRTIPPGDGGLSLGQAVAGRLIAGSD